MAFPSLTQVISDIVAGALAKARGMIGAQPPTQAPRGAFTNPFDDLMRRAAPRFPGQQAARDAQGSSAPAGPSPAHAAYYSAAANGLRSQSPAVALMHAASAAMSATQPSTESRTQWLKSLFGPLLRSPPAPQLGKQSEQQQSHEHTAAASAFSKLSQVLQSAGGNGRNGSPGTTVANAIEGMRSGPLPGILSKAEHLLGTGRGVLAAAGLAGGAAGFIGTAITAIRAGVALNRANLANMAELAPFNGRMQDAYTSLSAGDRARRARMAAALAPGASEAAAAQNQWNDAVAKWETRWQGIKNSVGAPAARVGAKELNSFDSMWNTFMVQIGATTWDQLKKEQAALKKAADAPLPLTAVIRDLSAGRWAGQRLKPLPPIK